MKLNNFVLALTAVTLLPAFAYAGTDTIAASFERDWKRNPVESAVIAGEPDAFTTEFYAALNGTTDAVLASFERDMVREPVKSAIGLGEADALTMEFSIALNDKADPVLASFDRDMYRASVNTVATIAGEPDVLTAEFYAALRDVVGKPVMHATAGNRIGG